MGLDPAAWLVVDLVGGKARRGADELQLYARLIEEQVGRFGGRSLSLTGVDPAVIELAQAVPALRCALGIQASLVRSFGQGLQARIALHGGEGDAAAGTKLASQLTSFAEAGGLCASKPFISALGQSEVPFASLGPSPLPGLGDVELFAWPPRSGAGLFSTAAGPAPLFAEAPSPSVPSPFEPVAVAAPSPFEPTPPVPPHLLELELPPLEPLPGEAPSALSSAPAQPAMPDVPMAPVVVELPAAEPEAFALAAPAEEQPVARPPLELTGELPEISRFSSGTKALFAVGLLLGGAGVGWLLLPKSTAPSTESKGPTPLRPATPSPAPTLAPPPAGLAQTLAPSLVDAGSLSADAGQLLADAGAAAVPDAGAAVDAGAPDAGGPSTEALPPPPLDEIGAVVDAAKEHLAGKRMKQSAKDKLAAHIDKLADRARKTTKPKAKKKAVAALTSFIAKHHL